MLRVQQGYRWHQGHWGLSGALGLSGGVGGVGLHLGAGRKCRYSGASRGISAIREHWGS